MMGTQDTLLQWENFYIIVGSSAGALTGLQFVVIALVAQSQARTSKRELDAFGTPTIVHFCAVLLVSAILSAPWPALSQAAVVVGICGAAGTVYSLIVVRRTRRTTNYKPELEDWIWHCVLPLIAYATLLIGGATLPFRHVPALFGIAVFALILLFVGIHNAWDAVTYITVGIKESPTPPGKVSAPSDVDS
jgi:chromate transport protein ChrA